MNEESLKKINKELSDTIIVLRELMKKGYVLCPECSGQDSARIYCNLCGGKGYVHYSIMAVE